VTRAVRRLSIRARLTLWYTGVLVTILVVVSLLSYSMLRWSLLQDVDTSLLAVADVLRDTGYPEAAADAAQSQSALRDLLGLEPEDKIIEFADPHGRARPGSGERPAPRLPMSSYARDNAVRGALTFESVDLPSGRARLLTVPIVRKGTLTAIVKIGMSLERAERALDRYAQTLLVLVPLGIGLAALGGGLIARKALEPVDEMSRTARRITGEDLGQRLPLRGTRDELDHLAGTLNAMLDRLQSAFDEVRRFAADAAHELRTPLTVLRGGVEVALRAERSPAEYRRVLESSLEEVERLVRLSEDLLLLSRFASGVPPSRTRVELEPLVLDVLDAGARLGHARGVTVRLGQATPTAVLGEPSALRRAILNLVDNAVKYTPPGGRVELALSRADGRAVVAVKDTGIGIDAADRETVFQPFVRLEAARAGNGGGAGLGLSIARSIVDAHGGTLEVESRRGAGATFRIVLPVAPERSPDGTPD
jgi:heavy metal sensor kinase